MPTRAVGAPNLDAAEAVAAPPVFCTRHAFKMRRVHAQPDSTEMIQLLTLRDGTSEDHVRGAMSIEGDTAAFPVRDIEASVALPANRPRPEPTASIRLGLRSGVEALV